MRLATCCGRTVLRTRTVYLEKVAGDEVEWSAKSFPYFYQVFRGDEYLRGADLICARGFAGRRVSQSSPSPFFFFHPHPLYATTSSPEEKEEEKEKE